MIALSPQYNPKEVEERLYAQWESSGAFGVSSKVKKGKKPYTIVIPPPNITGILHMGHALNVTIQDVLIRTQRMQGADALWIPGTDHAGIATQNVVEKQLAKEGRTRHDLGREAFLRRIWDWKEHHGNTIIRQLKRLGASCDWNRTRFTMDEGLSEAVLEVFVQLYKKDLIYRGTRIIHWCPRCQTALSDEEAPRQETLGKLYHIRYPVEDGGTIEVATTRPETMLGDTAIFVHPKDPRYQGLVGKFASLPLVGRRIPIKADSMVDRDFGTGAVKVTPAHDPADYKLGKKHNLEFINVMTDDARMTKVPAAYEGLDRFECRSKLIVDLEAKGYLGPIEEHTHNVGRCYRCQTVVEPRLSAQWFVRMKSLAKPAISAVKTGKTRFVPERWTKVYLHWMENIEDWCISRQIWWGHRLPVWYCRSCVPVDQEDVLSPGKLAEAEHDKKGIIVSKRPPKKCPSCGSTTDLVQDEDVLDTWFSSWLWPFSTLGWPNPTKDLERFYPTSTLVTAPEIIFFWVARMIMAGYFCMGKTPFKDVYIHGTVRDITGKKMSKSLGNVIDPLQMIEEYGTDALRYTLVTSTAIGQDISLSEERFVAGRNFANKLWNATRFLIAQKGILGRHASSNTLITARSPLADRWILSKLQNTTTQVTKALDAFQISEAATTLYDFLWHDVCDWYLEVVKVGSGKPEYAKSAQVLRHCLDVSFRLLHPIMPFVTEELWQQVKDQKNVKQSLINASWPKANKKWINAQAEKQFEQLQKVIGAVRNIRAEFNVPVDSYPTVRVIAKSPIARKAIQSQESLLKTFARVAEVRVEASGKRSKDSAGMVLDGLEVLVPLAGLIDVEHERSRLGKRLDVLTRDLSRQEVRLKNKDFIRKAPKEIIAQGREHHSRTTQILKQIKEHLSILESI